MSNFVLTAHLQVDDHGKMTFVANELTLKDGRPAVFVLRATPRWHDELIRQALVFIHRHYMYELRLVPQADRFSYDESVVIALPPTAALRLGKWNRLLMQIEAIRETGLVDTEARRIVTASYPFSFEHLLDTVLNPTNPTIDTAEYDALYKWMARINRMMRL